MSSDPHPSAAILRPVEPESSGELRTDFAIGQSPNTDSHGLYDPLPLHSLLTVPEKTVLSESVVLGCPLALLDSDGGLILGPAPPVSVLRSRGETPEVTDVEAGTTYLVRRLSHDGQQLGFLVAGPIAAGIEGENGSEAEARVERSQKLKTAHYLLRLGSQVVASAIQRALATRLYLLHVEEAYCELETKSQRLEQAIARMKDADQVKANFLATVSHELRTPLTSVLGYSEMLMEGLAGPLNDEQRDYLETVMLKGEQLLGLIIKLLDVSRIESVGVKLDRGPIELRELIGDALSALVPQARRKRLSVSAVMPTDLPRIDGDREKLGQVFKNLIGNAIKFTPERGEVRIEACIVDGETPHTKAVRVSVLDSGIGIPAHLQKKVFDVFYQVDSGATRVYEGSGLGLAIVRRFVEAHGGKVWVEDRKPRGAIFHLTLPPYREPAQPS